MHLLHGLFLCTLFVFAVCCDFGTERFVVMLVYFGVYAWALCNLSWWVPTLGFLCCLWFTCSVLNCVFCIWLVYFGLLTLLGLCLVCLWVIDSFVGC